MGDLVERREARQRANRARKNAKTCPASRHVHMIVDELTAPKGAMYQLLEGAGFEPAHMGGSIATVLACLWEARQFMEWEQLPPTKRYPLANGRWVPIRNTDEIERLRARVAELEARLEVVPGFSESADGIACRDDTIRLQDARIAALEATVRKLTGDD